VIGLAHLGGPIACLGLALLLVAKTQRERIAGLAFGAFGACVLGASLAPDRPLELTGGALAALGIGLGLALAFRRLPWLFPVLALACVPVRVGVHVGHANTKLLLPLYIVILGGTILLAWDLVAGDRRVRELRALSWPLAAYLGWTGLSIVWSHDVSEGAVELLAFYVPLTLLALCVARLPWSRLGLRALYAEATVMAVVFAAVGFYQYDTRNIFENPKLGVSNAYAPFFRVNSVFWDPSVYGRFLVVAMAPSLVLVVLGRSLRWSVVAIAVLVVTWLGLLISFSQSSFSALGVAVFCAAAIVWRWKSLLALAAVLVVVVALVAAQPRLMHALRHHTTSGLNGATHGRASLVANGIRIAKAHPALGVGLGGFEHAYSKRTHRTARKSASHDTPVTVAAEEGAVGLLIYFCLVGSLLLAAYRRIGHPVYGHVALAAGLALVAIFVHSLSYNDFFEDPTTWGLIGLIGLVAPIRVRAREPRAVEQTAEQPVPEMIAQ
jgi:O-antigen ligase